ncbi:uncharacterized protein LOC121998924 [Zingiber officinale]|uniref:uncharacterized protein LOC121998585 n=1 Tax=Zingiber officinale TaxID=94328 RepID=UPI001C4B5EED|nr:uncharacterized protein LOC121998585 [Zingiber officinale]XP_042409969.1 uncharacterized protein LOC121998924 [Zingiber officinale]
MKHFISAMLVLFLLLLSPNRSKGIRLLMEEQSLNSKHYHLHEDSLRSHDMSKEKKSGALIDSKQGEVHVYSSLPPRPETKPPTTMQKYPDNLDIAGMDYSPAKRKPPIHN